MRRENEKHGAVELEFCQDRFKKDPEGMAHAVADEEEVKRGGKDKPAVVDALSKDLFCFVVCHESVSF